MRMYTGRLSTPHLKVSMGPHSHLGGILSLLMINDEAETAFYHLLMMMSPRLLMSMAELMSYTLASLFKGTEPDV